MVIGPPAEVFNSGKQPGSRFAKPETAVLRETDITAFYREFTKGHELILLASTSDWERLQAEIAPLERQASAPARHVHDWVVIARARLSALSDEQCDRV
jgi:hypothetical protein